MTFDVTQHYEILHNCYVISLTKKNRNFKISNTVIILNLFIGNVVNVSFLLRGTETVALVPILPQKVGYFIAVWGDMGKNNVRVKPSLEKARHKNVGGFIFIVIT